MTMKAKLKAFAYHVGISAAVVALALGLVYGLWYRSPFAFVEDVYKITLILACVDVVIGPLLTLVVYNPAKKSLKFDLAMIGVMQFAALAYGLVTLHSARPIYSVYADGKFWSVTAPDYEAEEMAKVPKDSPYLRYPTWSPEWIGAIVPDSVDAADKQKIKISQAMGGGLRLMPRFYTPYEKVAADALSKAKRASELDFNNPPPAIATGSTALKPPTKEELQSLLGELKALGRPLDQLMLLPLNGSKKRAIVILEDKTGKILGTATYAPFW